MRGFTKIKKKHLLKISAVYLIGKAEICQDPPTWSQDDQTLLECLLLSAFATKKSEVDGANAADPNSQTALKLLTNS